MHNNKTNKIQVVAEKAPQAIGPYSHAIRAGDTVYISGQIPLHPETMELISEDIILQTRQVLDNLKAVTSAAGGSLDHIVKLTIYLTDLSLFAQVNEIMIEYFHAPYPARATIGVSALPRGSKIEIEAVMFL